MSICITSDALPCLRAGHSYIRSGGIFSRLVTLFPIDSHHDARTLLIADSTESLEEIRAILARHLGIHAVMIDDLRAFFTVASLPSGVYIATESLLTTRLPTPYEVEHSGITFVRDTQSSMTTQILALVEGGYHHSDTLSRAGSYRAEGDTLRVRPHLSEHVFRIGFFGNTVDEIVEETLHGEMVANHDRIRLPFYPSDPRPFVPDIVAGGNGIEAYLADTRVVLFDLDFSVHFESLRKRIPHAITFACQNSVGSISLDVETVTIPRIESLTALLSDGKIRSYVYTRYASAFEGFLRDNALPRATIMSTAQSSGTESFRIGNTLFLTDDILGTIFVRKRLKKSLSHRLDLLLSIREGDYVVHTDHGIGCFAGIIEKTTGGQAREYLEIGYAEGDRLYVPLSEAYRIGRYVGEEKPTLTRLSGNEWKKILASAEADAEALAEELLERYATREVAIGFSFPPYPEEERRFQAAFPYTYTPDQEAAIVDTLADMAKPEPMDRLISGDVGFGKTEVAMNAIYRAFLSGKQTAFVSPLVVLAFEHYESLQKRFAEFGVNIAIATRVSSMSEITEIKKGLKNGKIHCVIGTHRLLSPDLIFHDLGLLILDEEHKFGVMDKERIQSMRAGVDVLALSATPIPRSLHLALSGIREMSVIATPPPCKQSIETAVARADDDTIRTLIERELSRGGQVLYIHNRITTQDTVARHLREILSGVSRAPHDEDETKQTPSKTKSARVSEKDEFSRGSEVRLITVHGQMDGVELEDRIMDFKKGKYDILLSTTVIENGVNFLKANTILIDDAGDFGLAQLHQLRGRVGRANEKGYCTLLYRDDVLPPDAKKRLVALVNHSHLGAGFDISMQDLQIRGAGEILGIRQSGKTPETGLSLYFELLERKIAELQHKKPQIRIDTAIELDIPYRLPDDTFSSDMDKIHFFRSVEHIADETELDEVRATFADTDGRVDERVDRLFRVLRVRLRLSGYRVTGVRRVMTHYVVEFAPETPVMTLRAFLEYDRKGVFIVASGTRMRTEIANFVGDEGFLGYLEGWEAKGE